MLTDKKFRLTSDGIFFSCKEKGNGVKSGKTNRCKNNSADDLQIRTKDTSNKVVLEKTNQTPVDCADDDQRQNQISQRYHSLQQYFAHLCKKYDILM